MPFTLEEYHERLDNVVNEMKRQNVGVLVSSRPENMYYLSNYQTVGNPVQVLVVTKDGDMLLITRELEVSNAKYRAITKYAHYNEGQNPLEVIADHINKFCQDHISKFEGRELLSQPDIGFEYNSERMTYENQEKLEEILSTKYKASY